MLVVTHDPRLVPFADRIVHIEDGNIVREETGGAARKSQDILEENEHVEAQYGHRDRPGPVCRWRGRGDRAGPLRRLAGDDGRSAQQNDKRWLAVAPGRVEPPSGIIKVAAPTIGIVSKVLVKVMTRCLPASR